jgi:hypothetical protein
VGKEYRQVRTNLDKRLKTEQWQAADGLRPWLMPSVMRIKCTMNETERRNRLLQWLEIIYTDVQDLLLDDYLFWELQDIVAKNSEFRKAHGLFTQWMASSYIQSSAVGVRRQAKLGDDSIALKRFLNEIQHYPWLVSREHYISLYLGKEDWLIDSGQRDFDYVAGTGASELQSTLIDTQIKELRDAVSGIEHYVDRKVAHYDKRGLAKPTPTFNDLSNALNTIEKIVLLYWRLLKGATITTTRPTFQFDWKDIFRFAWEPLAQFENIREVSEDTDV